MNLGSASDYFKKPGTIGVIPTDTVYGLAAKARDQEAVKRLYGLKDRDSKPGTVIASNIEQLVELGLKRRYLKAVSDYWPAPLSVIIPCGNELSYLHLGKYGLAVRLPDDKDLIVLLDKVGPLLTSSANISGQEPANTVEEARNYFKDKVDFYIDGGDLSGRQPSTIVRVVDDAVEVIRPGAFKIDDQS
jgi:tRNA threonylcarbamoyl adenosine modification protein (Sua5/YciO/YrdC/YwlC family)